MKQKNSVSIASLLKILILIIIAFDTAPFAIAQDAAKSGGERQSPAVLELQKDIDQILDTPDFSNALIGVYVQSIESGEVLYKRNEARNFIPASTEKLFTTATALKILGPDYQYKTALYLDGEKKNGVFTGNVIIRGGGDPTISPSFGENPGEFLDKWADKIASQGIKSIQGNIIADSKFFDRVYYGQGWSWDDFVYPFSAQVNALSINDNRVDVILNPSDNVGDPALFKLLPSCPYIRMVNNVKTVAENKVTEIIPWRDVVTGVVELNGRIVRDSVRKESVVSVSVDNPAQFFMNLFKQALENKKIDFTGALLDADECNEKITYVKLKPIAERTSPPIKEIINYINRNSHNLASEMLLKTIGKEASGVGSFGRGVEQVKKFALLCNIPKDSYSVADGSGLSRFNMNSPRNFVSLLNYMYKSDLKDVFTNSLAQPGKNGTLKRRMTKSLAENNVFAKTGSLNGVSTLTGYVKNRDGQMIAFSIMIQNQTVPDAVSQNLQDLICMRLASSALK